MTRTGYLVLSTCCLLPACLLPTIASAEKYSVDVWSDNWFEFSVDGAVVAVDSVPITTERSFNAESFSFEADSSFTVGLKAMDFKENNTGLEYIGKRKQQMGDGGVIAQIRDSKGDVVAVTDATWRCLVTHEAPLDKSCEKESNPVAGEGTCGFVKIDEPEGWTNVDFDDSSWLNAQIYSEADVSPKQGYDRISWSEDAKLIWGPDLETNNTLLCRFSLNK